MTPDTLPRASDLPPPATPGAETIIDVDHFSLWYGTSHALKDVSMRIGSRQVTALIGPSGCGKSTLLRSLNRLNDLVEGIRTEGEVRLRGKSVYARGTDVIALRKRMSMVFQKQNPFPKSIYENVVFGLRVDGENLYDKAIDPVQVRKRIGMVFQKPNPFPKTIYDNVAFGPRLEGIRNCLLYTSDAADE